jgi:hypothetical protein
MSGTLDDRGSSIPAHSYVCQVPSFDATYNREVRQRAADLDPLYALSHVPYAGPSFEAAVVS